MAKTDAKWRSSALRCRSSGESLWLRPAEELGSGGEGTVYRPAETPSLVAKIYREPTEERARKLEVMIASPPTNPMRDQSHHTFAWPVDLLTPTHSEDEVVGFLMPFISGMKPIFELYNPSTRRKDAPLFSWLYLHRAARNLTTAFAALHERGYVIGDVNESNVLVSASALVTLVDCDSFQIRAPDTGEVFRCKVGRGEFTPPELQGVTFGDVDRTPQHDVFALGVLVFQMLMEGVHPFAGVFGGQGDAPTYAERIGGGSFPFGRRGLSSVRPTPIAPPFEMLDPSLRRLFVRCFEEGHASPDARPSAREWQSALETAEGVLEECSENEQHVHGRHVTDCPWCRRRDRLAGRDPFPSREAVSRGEHLRPVERASRVLLTQVPLPIPGVARATPPPAPPPRRTPSRPTRGRAAPTTGPPPSLAAQPVFSPSPTDGAAALLCLLLGLALGFVGALPLIVFVGGIIASPVLAVGAALFFGGFIGAAQSCDSHGHIQGWRGFLSTFAVGAGMTWGFVGWFIGQI